MKKIFKVLVILSVALTVVKIVPAEVKDGVLFVFLLVLALAVYITMQCFESWRYKRDSRMMENARKEAGLRMKIVKT
jgi:hypothetical protein